MRILYFGMPGEFSRWPLIALLEAGVAVCAVIVPARSKAVNAPFARVTPTPDQSDVPIVDPYLERSILHDAFERGIPVVEIGRPGHPETLAALSDLQPDAACVACFPQRIPKSLLALPRFGFLNLHPSLLPAYRGPQPLFWTFRNGENSTGVTIHFMDEGLDTGDIALQAPLDLPDGVSGAEAERLCATLGGRLMVEAVHRLQGGTLDRRPQPDGGSSFPSPTAEDFTISTTWPARRAFNFIRGAAGWGQPYRVGVDDEQLALKSAVSYSADETLGQPMVRSQGEVWIQFAPGVLRASTA
jgi:methionyl-tRNA formyltransferase